MNNTNVTRPSDDRMLLVEVLARLARIEHRLNEVAEDTDALDRFNRPYGDGTRTSRRRRP